jgi:hypothetical protein
MEPKLHGLWAWAIATVYPWSAAPGVILDQNRALA